MPRPGGHHITERSKDFKGSIIRLLKNLNPWKYLMSIALILAMISAILSLIAPNKLSDFADTIGEGLVPNTEKLVEINEKMASNLTEEKLQIKMQNLYKKVNLTQEEQQKTNEIFLNITKEKDKQKIMNLLISLPDKVLEYLLEDIKIDKTTITAKDQVEMLTIMNKLEITNNKKMLQELDKLPKSIYNIIKPEINMNKIKEITFFMATLYILSALFNFIQSFSLATVSNKFANKLRDNISKKINKLPLKYFDTHEIGDVLSRVTNDIDTVAMNLNNSLATLVTSITLFLGSIIMMFITNWIMALTAILSSIIGFTLMFLILSKSQK